MLRRLAFLVVLSALTAAMVSFMGGRRAQWVDVSRDGGVHVWAPFVRVHVDPYGGTSVRAPFTAVDVPGRGYPGVVEQRVVEQSVLSARELAIMDDEELWQFVLATADRLYQRLGRFDTGESWQRYLRLPEDLLADLASDSREPRDALAKLLDRFRYVAREPRYAKISNLSEFAEMQATLTEVVSRPDASAAAGSASDEELPLPQSDDSAGNRVLSH